MSRDLLLSAIGSAVPHYGELLKWERPLID
jgi:hypothetical protein